MFHIRRAVAADADLVQACLEAAFAPYRESYTPGAFRDTVPTREGVTDRIERMLVLGVAILAKWVLQDYLDAGTVRGVRITAKGFHRRWQAVVPKRLAGRDYITEFCRLLVSHAPRLRPGFGEAGTFRVGNSRQVRNVS